jgi:pectinesterase
MKTLPTFLAVLSAALIINSAAGAPAADSGHPEAAFIVAADGSGDYLTVQEAVNAAPNYLRGNPVVIFIKNGTYPERVTVPPNKTGLWLVGESADRVVITADVYASQTGSTGHPVGTSGTATVYIHAEDFRATGITFENSARHPQGIGNVGQAVAVCVTGDRVRFTGCRFIGNQDTLYTMGTGSLLFEGCWIEGTTDFIFGASTALFRDCTIHSKRDSYITAASTPEGRTYGYVFTGCRLTAAEGVTKVYLGRPWRPFAKTVFAFCELGAHILPAGWHNWNKPDAERTSFYAEYENTGPGADGRRVVWAHTLTPEQAAALTPANVLGEWAE